MTELKPCPFCGGCDGDPTVYASNQNGWYVYCKCGARVGYFKTAEFAIEAWNTRAERTCRIVKAARKYVLSDGTELFEDGCSICNGYISDDDNYCSNCGAKVVDE